MQCWKENRNRRKAVKNEISILEWILNSSENLINERRFVEAKATGVFVFFVFMGAIK